MLKSDPLANILNRMHKYNFSTTQHFTGLSMETTKVFCHDTTLIQELFFTSVSGMTSISLASWFIMLGGLKGGDH
jgi:hypothetical protein